MTRAADFVPAEARVHPGVNALVQCGILYDVTRVPRTVVNCYELR